MQSKHFNEYGVSKGEFREFINKIFNLVNAFLDEEMTPIEIQVIERQLISCISAACSERLLRTQVKKRKSDNSPC